MQGCFASRYVFARGDPLYEVLGDSRGEAQWIHDFKFGHAYEVRNGWKRWESDEATSFAEGGDGLPFHLSLECAADICSVSSATSLIAATFSAAVLFLF